MRLVASYFKKAILIFEGTLFVVKISFEGRAPLIEKLN
tara:strand:- start:2042 stop:2155 length:114 start_codon:yes stop_codon:yes gene_type:complete